MHIQCMHVLYLYRPTTSEMVFGKLCPEKDSARVHCKALHLVYGPVQLCTFSRCSLSPYTHVCTCVYVCMCVHISLRDPVLCNMHFYKVSESGTRRFGSSHLLNCFVRFSKPDVDGGVVSTNG